MLLPPGHKLLLALLPLGKVLGVLGLLQGMPVVQDPVGRNHLSFESTATGTVGKVSGLEMPCLEKLPLSTG